MGLGMLQSHGIQNQDCTQVADFTINIGVYDARNQDSIEI